jgi:hypothetical protein
MEMIVPTRPVGGVSRTARPDARGGSGFAVAEESAGVAMSAATVPLAPAAMLALQELDSQTVQDREARKKGEAVLLALTALQRARLGGSGSTANLAEVLAAAGAMTSAQDPRLVGILEAVMLRARVELARAHATPQEHFITARGTPG